MDPEGSGSFLPTADLSVPLRVGCRRTDEFQEIYVAGSRALQIFQDFSLFVCSEAARRVLPWPLETMQSRFSEWWQQQWEAANEIFPKEAALETIEVCRNFSMELLELLEPHLEVPRQHLKNMTTQMDEAAQGIVETFLEKYPQHRPSLAGVQPVVMFVNLILFLIGFIQLLYVTARLLTLPCRCCRRPRPRGRKGKVTAPESNTSATSSDATAPSK